MKKLLAGIILFGSASLYAQSSCPYDIHSRIFTPRDKVSAIVEANVIKQNGEKGPSQFFEVKYEKGMTGRLVKTDLDRVNNIEECGDGRLLNTRSGNLYCSQKNPYQSAFYIVIAGQDCWISYPSSFTPTLSLSSRIIKATLREPSNPNSERAWADSLSVSRPSSDDKNQIGEIWKTIDLHDI